MPNKRSPPPSKSSERVKEYLEIVEKAEIEKGCASGYDFLKKAMNEAQKNRMIKYLADNRLIFEAENDKYKLTEKGKALLEIMERRELVGILTRELSGDRIKRW